MLLVSGVTVREASSKPPIEIAYGVWPSVLSTTPSWMLSRSIAAAAVGSMSIGEFLTP